MPAESVNMSVNIAGVTFKNPVTVASGTFGSGMEYSEYVDLNRLGAVTTKGVANVPWPGNPTPRIAETYGGMINAIGLQNPGLDTFLTRDIPFLKKYDTKIIVNVCGKSKEDYIDAVEKLSEAPVDMLEINISCPNVKSGGIAFGIKSEVAYEVVKKAKSITDKTLMVKLSPNAEDIVDMAIKCQEAGADSLSLINTLKGLAINPYKRKAVFNNVYAGLSGPAVKPVALRMVHEVAKAVEIPVIGLGGITTGLDAIEFMMAGASAIQIGTVNFFNPMAGKEIIEEMELFCKEQGIKDINEIIGII